MENEPSPTAPSLLARWEALPAAAQAGIVFVPVTIILTAVHLAFFHRITTARSIAYALGEGAIIAGLVAIASQNEARARELRQADESADDTSPK